MLRRMRRIHTRNSVPYATTGYRGSMGIGTGNVSSRVCRTGKPDDRPRSGCYPRASRIEVCFVGPRRVPVTGVDEHENGSRVASRRDDVETTREEATAPDTTNGGWGSRPTQHRAARRDTKEISRPPCWRWLRDGRGLTIM